jgi:hypothetical protein
MEKLNEFIIKQLNDKKTQRWIIMAVDLFELCINMAIIDDDDLMIDIIKYLEENEIDINFSGGENFHKDFVRLEHKIKMEKMLNGSKTEVQKIIEKVESIKVPERPDWLSDYMDDEVEIKTSPVVNEDVANQLQRIGDILRQELRNQVELEPIPTIEEIREEIRLDTDKNNN